MILMVLHQESRGPDSYRLGVIQELLSARGIVLPEEKLIKLQWMAKILAIIGIKY